MRLNRLLFVFGTLALTSTAVMAQESGNNGCTIGAAIDKIGSPYVRQGGDTEYLITVHNTGSCVLKGLTLVDYLAKATHFKGALPLTRHTPEGWGGAVKWKGDKLYPGQSAYAVVKVTVADQAPRFLQDKACFTATSAYTPPRNGGSEPAAQMTTGWQWCDTFTQKTGIAESDDAEVKFGDSN